MMPNDTSAEIIESAIAITSEMNRQQTDVRWLEELTVEVASYIREWDIEDAWRWGEWPEKAEYFPKATDLDVGIDVVAKRRGDGRYVAIQCKSRQLNADGSGGSITHAETSKFTSASSGKFWAEQWIVTNGNNPLASGALQAVSMSDMPVKMVNITNDLHQQREVATTAGEPCPHCDDPDAEDAVQTKSCMQNEEVADSVRILREHELSTSGGLPRGEARGRIILPCGTGKTRISPESLRT